MIAISSPPILGGQPTINDSEANPMLKTHAYFAQTPGYVNARTTGETVNELKGYIGNTNDPVSAGDLIAREKHTETADDNNIMFFVAKGLYFEITSDGTPTIFWTPLIRGGASPIDFN